jgi:hypothetical protein
MSQTPAPAPVPVPATVPRSSAIVLVSFVVAVLLGALLLFLLEPFVGKSLLPQYGGAPAVWITCVFFFQLVLLLGYVYAYALDRHLPVVGQLLVHAALIGVALATLPVAFRFATLGNVVGERLLQNPLPSLLVVLTLSVGLPFFVIAATAPLAQAWYARAQHLRSPYFLYVASNAGSLTALVLYPVLIEKWLPLSRQSRYLSILFVVFGCLIVVCGGLACFLGSKSTPAPPRPRAAGPAVTTRLRIEWFLWSACPASLMLGVTTYLSSEIAPIPLLWMLPLGLYLLSFVIAFAFRSTWLSYGAGIVYFGSVMALATSNGLFIPADHLRIGLHLSLLFFGSLCLTSELARHAPHASHLTEYYLWLALGGASGSLFNSLIAPVAFNWLAEYPLAIVLGIVLLPWPSLRFRWWTPVRRTVCVAAGGLLFLALSWNVYFSESAGRVLTLERTFFGPLRVEAGTRGVMHVLYHGNTIHGMQIASSDPRLRRIPLTYYYPTGPIGRLFGAYQGTDVVRSVGIVGLGVGSLAAYGGRGQEVTFYEIDPEIDRVARDTRLFTFLRDADGRGVELKTRLGDARLRLQEAPDHSFGLLVVDAFTGDSIPTHLLTEEALRLYQSKLKPNGILAFNISNTYLDLEPVLGNIATKLGQTAYVWNDHDVSDEDASGGKFGSSWLVMASSDQQLQKLLAHGDWRPCRTLDTIGIWTDDQSSLLNALRW